MAFKERHWHPLMANGSVLELATLPERHPAIGEPLLRLCGAQAIIRLCIDPVQLNQGSVTRQIKIDWKSQQTGGKEKEIACEIAWTGLEEQFSSDYCCRVTLTVNADEITEKAAIAVMALLIHELESETVETVLPIGSGGDYYLSRKNWGKPVQIEVSGIREDRSERLSSRRLRQKCEQVLKKSRVGFASVTTFSFGKTQNAHSYLHYVVKGKASQKSKKPSKKQ